jgi:PKHD-type hydroxylase
LYERKLSFTVQLSDSDAYTGGDLEFLEVPSSPELREQLRQKGTVIVFPSFLQHRVTEITEGQRHALVSWREGKQWT